MKNSDDNRPFAEVSEEGLKNLLKRVRAYAYRRYGWLQNKIGTGRLDIEAEMLNAIEDTFFEIRHWRAADGWDDEITLYKHICGVVSSRIRNIVAREKMLPHIDIDEILAYPDSEASKLVLQDIILQELVDKLKEKLGPEAALATLLDLANLGMTTKEIAAITGWSESAVLNARKRLRRKAEELKKDLERRKKIG